VRCGWIFISTPEWGMWIGVAMKIKPDKNDILFSKMIRERDRACVFCGKTADEGKLECSHFWGRGDKVNRFNPLNCDTLCFYCHLQNEGNKQGFYRRWKLAQLGEGVYKDIENDHYKKTKKYGKAEKINLHNILITQYKNKSHLQQNWVVEW